MGVDGRSKKKKSHEWSFHNKSFRGSVSDSEDLPKTLSEIEIQLTERNRSSSVSVESLGLYRSRSMTMDRDRSGSTNSCKLDIPIPEEGPAVKEVDPVALGNSANC